MENENKFIPKYIRQKISDNEMILTFTSSGNTYKFTSIDIQKAQLQAFKDVNAMNIKEIADIITVADHNNDGLVPVLKKYMWQCNKFCVNLLDW